jgi:acyl carrier protein
MAMHVSFEQIAEFLAEHQGIDPSRIAPGVRLEADLGITGDDGHELLVALMSRFHVEIDRTSTAQASLLHSEGSDPFALVSRVLGRGKERVIPITVGDLHLAALRGHWEDPPWPAI